MKSDVLNLYYIVISSCKTLEIELSTKLLTNSMQITITTYTVANDINRWKNTTTHRFGFCKANYFGYTFYVDSIIAAKFKYKNQWIFKYIQSAPALSGYPSCICLDFCKFLLSVLLAQLVLYSTWTFTIYVLVSIILCITVTKQM